MTGQAVADVPREGAATGAFTGDDVLTMGVEEEFLLVDPVTRRTVPRATAVLGRAAGRPAPDAAYHTELAATQVEASTGVCTGLPELRRQIAAGRALLAAAARAEGLRLISTGTPVLAGPPAPFSLGERAERIARRFAGVVAGYEACGCHVHLGVPDRDTAVAVVNHLRPWLPTLLALSVNSPFDRGRDSGYGSWRIQEQARFPGAGVPPWFPSAAAYDDELNRLIECGVLVDARMSFWLARPSPHLPTVEIRAADAAATVDEAVLQAALARALVRTALTDLSAGRQAPGAGEQICAAAVWSAARHGIAGPAVHPLEERRVPACRLLEELLARIRPALEEAGDLAEVHALLHRILGAGSGAARQRRAAVHGLPAVIDMLVRQTMPRPEPGGGGTGMTDERTDLGAGRAGGTVG